ncbi:MAG: tRNA pseudouridine(38-40) synthase TruA [Actinomycetota bacterium]|nr:tRNA pseudouridine(38-40) synthase TruA [Actinomycetota bacterium]
MTGVLRAGRPSRSTGGPEAVEPGGAGTRWRFRIAYDGTPFHGFAVQPGQVTVAGVLSEALTRHTGVPVDLTCAGRTDRGVHAAGQVVHADLPAPVAATLDATALVRSCNRQLAPSVAVLDAGAAPDGFDARRSALSRTYRYLVVDGPVPDPLLAGRTWHVPGPLDLRAMAAAADAVLGEQDFRAFCRRVPGTDPGDPIPRRVLDARWSDRTAGAPLPPASGRLLAFDIEASSFCHQMVRSLVGTLVDVGLGRRRAADVTWILRSGDRAHAAQPAPPGGLTLVSVRYPPGLGWDAPPAAGQPGLPGPAGAP